MRRNIKYSATPVHPGYFGTPVKFMLRLVKQEMGYCLLIKQLNKRIKMPNNYYECFFMGGGLLIYRYLMFRREKWKENSPEKGNYCNQWSRKNHRVSSLEKI